MGWLGLVKIDVVAVVHVAYVVYVEAAVFEAKKVYSPGSQGQIKFI